MFVFCDSLFILVDAAIDSILGSNSHSGTMPPFNFR